MTDPVYLLLALLTIVIIALAITGRIGQAQNIVVLIILVALLVVALRVLGLV